MRVIVLLADGVRVDTLRAALDAGKLPAMTRLRDEHGGGLHEIASTFPSVTGPAYTPFLMGRFPGPIGLPGLRWFDRARDSCTFPDYSRSYVGYQMGAINRDVDAAAPTIFELVPESAAALSVITRGLDRENQLAALTVGSALRAALTHYRGDPLAWLDVDREVGRRVVQRARDKQTRFIFAAFTGVDKMSHGKGHTTPEVVDALQIVDDTIAEIMGGGRDDTRIWIVSDHGHSPVQQHEDLERVVAAMGYRVIAHPWVYRMGAEVAVMVSGNAMSHLYVDLAERTRKYWSGMSPRGRELAEQLIVRESVDLMLVPLDDCRCEVRARTRGTGVVSWSGGGFSYARVNGDPLGIGADLSDATNEEAYDATTSTDYPDSVVQIARLAASKRSGDLILSASRDWDYRARYEPIPHVSSHGALHREHMAVPLLVDGPVIRKPRRTTDVFPSALTALGVPVPDGLDGQTFV
jgi:hypothetical protein